MKMIHLTSHPRFSTSVNKTLAVLKDVMTKTVNVDNCDVSNVEIPKEHN